MNRALLLLACFAAPACALAPDAAQTRLMASDERAIHQSVLLLIERTNNDPMATLQEYVQSDRVSSVNSETIVTGWDGLVEQTRAQQPGAFTMQTGTLDILGLGADHALVVAPFTIYYRSGGSTVSVPGSMSLAYQRTREGWKILHEHYSQGLDEQTRARLAQAASGNGRVTGADLLRLMVMGLGGGATALLGGLADMLASPACTTR